MARLHEELVAAFDALFGPHPGVRAAHAKGVCCDATFTATPEARALTRAPHLQGESVPATVRFSNGSGDPDAHDAGREPRGMSVKFHLADGRATDIVSINHPVFIVRTPEEFLEFLHLRTPDPSTGQLDFESLGKFVEARPESARAAEILLTAPPLASFLRTPYFAVHAYRFVASDDTVHKFGRYRWEPALELATLTAEEAQALPSSYLRDDLLDRLDEGPASFDLHIQIATEEDQSDPTTGWPDDREQIVAGRLEITGPAADQEACERFVFDPMRLADGIEASDDPVLRVRPRAYAYSSARRSATG